MNVRRSQRVSRRATKSPVGRSESASCEKPRQRSRSKKRSVSKETSIPECDASLVPSVDIQQMQKRVVKGVIIDSFCWICHKSCNEEPCDSCPRTYHKNCFNKEKVCDCKQKNLSGRMSHFMLSPVELKEMLQYTMQESIREEKKNASKIQKPENSIFCKFFKTWPDVPENKLLRKIIDLDTLIDKLNDTPPYQNTADFYSDVKWIYHNSCILYGVENEKTQTALKLQKNFLRELIDIEACHDCYRHKHSAEYDQREYTNTFTKVCRTPHRIVWAKLRGSPFWPAKCLKIYNGHADVRFFGTHDKSVIPLKQIYQISKAHPEGRNINKMIKLKEAMDELCLYVSNYEKKVGPFRFSEKQVPIEEAPSIVKKKPHKKQKSSRTKVPEEKSASDHVETKAKAILHMPFAPSEGNFSGNPDNSEPLENVSDSSSRVVCQMTFTADEENLDMSCDDFMNSSTTHDSPENNSKKEILSSVNATPLSHTIPESHLLPSSSEYGNSATMSRRNRHKYRNVSTPLPVITFAHSTREDITNHIPASNIICSAADTSTPSLETLHAPDKNLPMNEISDGVNEVQFEDDNEVQLLSETTSRRLSDIFFKTPEIDKTLAELLMSNKPNIRNLYDLFAHVNLRIFMGLMVEANQQKSSFDHVLNGQSFVVNCVKKVEYFKKLYVETLKELEMERAKNGGPQDKYQMTNCFIEAILNKSNVEKKQVEETVQGLKEVLKQREEENEELNIRINDIELRVKEKDEQIAELLNEREQCQCILKRNADDCQQNIPDNCIYNERNDAQTKDLPVSIFKTQADTNCDVNNDSCPVSESHQSYFTHAGLEGRMVLIQQSNLSTISNSSSYDGQVLCESSVLSGCTIGPPSMAGPPTTLMRVPLVVSTSSSMMHSPNASYFSSDAPCGYIIPSTSFQPEASGSSSSQVSGSSSRPKTSGTKASHRKSSSASKRQTTGVTNVKKRRKD